MEWAGLSREGIERRQVELIVEYLERTLPLAEFKAFKQRLDTGHELHHVGVHVGAQLVRPNPDWNGRPDALMKPSARARAVLEAALRQSRSA